MAPMAPMAGLPMAPMAGLPMARVTPTAMSPQMRPWSGADDGALDAPAEREAPGGLAVPPLPPPVQSGHVSSITPY